MRWESRQARDPLQLRHPVAGAILAAVGIASLALAIVHLVGYDEPPMGVLLGIVPPVALSLVIALAGLWLATTPLERGEAWRVLGWAFAGAVVGGGTTAMFALYQSIYGVALADATFAISAAGDGGVVTGLVLAAYDLRARRKHDALEATTQMLDTVRRVVQNASRADTRDALEEAVCYEVAAAEPYVSAWIGEIDHESETVTPRAAPAAAASVIEETTVPLDPSGTPPGPTATAAMTGEVQVVRDVGSHAAFSRWREPLAPYDIVSIVAIPLVYQGEQYGVLSVYGRRPDAFDSRNRQIFAELGETIAHALASLESRARLERQNDRLDALNELLRHDIRNDMSVISAHAERLRDAADDEDSVDVLLSKVDHVVELTTTARNLTRAMQDDGVDLEAVRLDAVLRQSLQEVRETYSGATVEVTDLPAVTVTANDLLASVFGNLLNNAIQHHDGDNPRIDVDVEVADRTVAVRVADDGPGIPEAMKDRVFEHGERGPGSTGTGLGLYLVRTLVGQYGGEVTVADNNPRGTVFTVTLPLDGEVQPRNEGLPAHTSNPRA